MELNGSHTVNPMDFLIWISSDAFSLHLFGNACETFERWQRKVTSNDCNEYSEYFLYRIKRRERPLFGEALTFLYELRLCNCILLKYLCDNCNRFRAWLVFRISRAHFMKSKLIVAIFGNVSLNSIFLRSCSFELNPNLVESELNEENPR